MCVCVCVCAVLSLLHKPRDCRETGDLFEYGRGSREQAKLESQYTNTDDDATAVGDSGRVALVGRE